jgi:O-antigen ligase
LKAEYFGLAFFVIYIANVSSTASNALISIGGGGLVLYAIYDYWKNKRHFPVPTADFQVPWWLFFVTLLVDSLLLTDKASISKSIEYLYLSLPFWVLLEVYYYHPNLKCLWGSIAATMVYVGGYSLYVYVIFNHLNPIRVKTFAANMNGLGTLLAMSLPFLLLMLAKYYKEHQVKTTVVILVSSCLGMAGLILTGSRGAVMGFVAGCLVLVIAKTILIDKHTFKTLIYGIVLCCIAAMGYASVFGMVHRGTDNQRPLFFKSSIAMWQDHPMLGVGLTNWKHFYYTKYKLPEAFEKNIDMPHNTFAFYFSTTGVLGGLGFLVFTLGILAYLLKKMHQQPDNILIQAMLWSFIAVSVHGLVDAGLSMKTALRLCSAYMGVTVASIILYEKAKLKTKQDVK